jgi:hypothetical protein
MCGDLIERMFAPAKAHFQPKRHITQAESRARVCCLRWGQPKPRQGFFQKTLLARAQRVASAPAIKAVWHTIGQRGSISGHARS